MAFQYFSFTNLLVSWRQALRYFAEVTNSSMLLNFCFFVVVEKVETIDVNVMSNIFQD